MTPAMRAQQRAVAQRYLGVDCVVTSDGTIWTASDALRASEQRREAIRQRIAQHVTLAPITETWRAVQ